MVKIPEKNLDIPRHKMPQIAGPHKPHFFEWLGKKGIKVTNDEIHPSKLTATQKHFNTDKVRGMIANPPKNDRIIVSNDNHIVDGHHRWLADYNTPGKKTPVSKVDLPIHKLLDTAKDYPNVTYKTLKEGKLQLTLKDFI